MQLVTTPDLCFRHAADIVARGLNGTDCSDFFYGTTRYSWSAQASQSVSASTLWRTDRTYAMFCSMAHSKSHDSEFPSMVSQPS